MSLLLLVCGALAAAEAAAPAPPTPPLGPRAVRARVPEGLVLAPVTPLAAVLPVVIAGGPPASKKIALTFDACPTRGHGLLDEKVFAVLVEQQVPATIFVSGRWMLDQPEATRRLAATPGVELASHSFWHRHMTRLSPERVREDLEWTERVLFALTGQRSRFFRPPFGEYDDKLVQLAAEQGLTTVAWTLAGGDSGPQATRERLVAWVLDQTQGGGIVLLHINGRGIHTGEAIGEIVSGLRTRGFELTTVSELIQPEPAPTEAVAASAVAEPAAPPTAADATPGSDTPAAPSEAPAGASATVHASLQSPPPATTAVAVDAASAPPTARDAPSSR